ncbi:MAG: hypothetical protein ACYDA8_13150 [Deferrisomatales bacterium]
MADDEEYFCDIPVNFHVQVFLDGMVRVRRDLYVDPLLAEPWSCDPDRCRPVFGRHLCCKVELRCPHFEGGRCRVHEAKPFDCALFPLDLVRAGNLRVVTTVKNMDFFQTGWCRFDRDMLRCFEGTEKSPTSMFETQRPVLERLFTQAEMVLMTRKLGELGAGGPGQAPR